MKNIIYSLLACLSTTVVYNSGEAADLPGSADYPSVGRFQGSEITFYKLENYGETTLATGPVRSPKDAETTALRVEGKITRIVYKLPKGTSALEVFRNFETRIAEGGFEAIFSGGPDEIKDYDFTYKHPVEILNKISLSSPIYYLSAKQSAGGSDIYLSLLVSPHSGGDGQRIRLIVAETKAMENQMVDADAMQTAISGSGKVVLYGIYFDTDSAAVKSESAPTLQEIEKLMKNSPQLKIVIVGHTDYEGGRDYNMALSERRARAVLETLVQDYGVTAQRLSSAGVGYLAPAATNESEDGRALNRRVELVKDK